MFKPGQSGNPGGRPKGAVSQRVALKNLLEEVFQENREKAKKLITKMFDDPADFRKLCDLKAQYEIKQMPTKLESEEGAGGFVVAYLPQVKKADA